MNLIVKAEFYDQFRCIADQCSFTCCKGWDISVDSDTCSKWRNDERHSEYLSKHLKIKKNKKADAFINMGTQKTCPYQNEKGLCNIVINCGEDYLSETCKVFPRLKNSYSDRTEYSMSCACPEVIDKIYSKDCIRFLYENGQNNVQTASLEYKIREAMIAMLQRTDFGFKDKAILIFYLLLSIKEGVDTTELIARYQEEKSLSAFASCWTGIEINPSDSIREINELFLDITQNYRKVKNFKPYLQEIYEIAEVLDLELDRSLSYLTEFNKAFAAFEKLLVNSIVVKIFSDCNSDDIEELIVSYQIIITEYLMIRHSAFLKFLMSQNIDREISSESSAEHNFYTDNQINQLSYADIRNYIVIYSRIIGYNSEGIREFWEDSFDNEVWELGYLMMLLG